MMKYRSAGGVAPLSGYVFCLGGHDGLSIFDSVERYDPISDSWTKVKPMLNKRCRLGAATLGGKLYVRGFYLTLNFVDTNNGFYRLVVVMMVTHFFEVLKFMISIKINGN